MTYFWTLEAEDENPKGYSIRIWPKKSREQRISRKGSQQGQKYKQGPTPILLVFKIYISGTDDKIVRLRVFIHCTFTSNTFLLHGIS